MGRPKGSTNKPKKVVLTKTQAKFAAEGDIPLNEFVKQINKKPRAVKPKVDWETLAKQLQQALAKEIKETDSLNARVHDLMADNIKLMGIIGYLEKRLGYHQV